MFLQEQLFSVSHPLHFFPGTEVGCIALDDAVLPDAAKNAITVSWPKGGWVSSLLSSFSFSSFVIYSCSYPFHPSRPPTILKMEPVTEKESGSVIKKDL